MTSLWSRFAMTGVALAGVTQVSASTALLPRGGAVPMGARPAPDRAASTQIDPLALRQIQAPAYLREQIRSLVRDFDGKSGIAVLSLRDGWEAGWNLNTLFPQQSCSKLWVAITAMDAVDRNQVSLSDRVTLTRSDLTVFHQPIRTKVLAGGHTTTLGSLLFQAITESDNTANDKLMRVVGGPRAVRDMIARKGLGAIRFYEGERLLQSRIAGLRWDPSYSLGGAFFEARAALPMSERRAAFDRYVADPFDGASPHAIATAIARLHEGQLLSPASTAKLLSIMGQTRTGKMRVRAALTSGWTWNHKTGTGQELGGRIGGINDIGLLTAPDGSVYALAIMTIPNASDGGAQQLMQSVTRAIIAQHNMSRGTATGL
jgi:beta-lactamase class A